MRNGYFVEIKIQVIFIEFVMAEKEEILSYF
jgi:hypothetical protein